MGVIRRRPDIKWKKKEGDILTLSALQKSLLKSASRAVVHGGRLIYSVCTVTHEEGSQVVLDFLKENEDFSLINDFPKSLKDANIAPGMLSFLPHKHGTDGFFYALMKRA